MRNVLKYTGILFMLCMCLMMDMHAEAAAVNNTTKELEEKQLALSSKKLTIPVGASKKLQAQLKNVDGIENVEKGEARFTSSNTRVAKVGKTTGLVTAKASGSCKIRCTVGGKTVSCYVKVRKSIQQSDIKVSAHRGYMSKYPENTLPAFKGALKAGFTGIECDVWETSNDDIMVFHDETTGRMCDKNVAIEAVNTKTRSQYKVTKGANIRKYGSLLIPTLEEMVKLISDNGGVLYLNLKYHGSFSNEGILHIKRVLEQYDMVDKTIVFCGNSMTLRRIDNNGLHAGILCTIRNIGEVNDKVDEAIRNHYAAMVIFYPSMVTQKQIDKCHAAGLTIGSYHVTKKSEMLRLISMGADFNFCNWKYFT